jgi:hypothetical protein
VRGAAGGWNFIVRDGIVLLGPKFKPPEGGFFFWLGPLGPKFKRPEGFFFSFGWVF